MSVRREACCGRSKGWDRQRRYLFCHEWVKPGAIIIAVVIEHHYNRLIERWIVLSSGSITIQWIAWFDLLTLIHWIAIYPVDTVMQPSNNLGPKCDKSFQAATWALLGLNGIRTQGSVEAWIIFLSLIWQLLKGGSSSLVHLKTFSSNFSSA